MDALTKRHVHVDAGPVELPADVVVPTPALGLVIFVHHAGGDRFSPGDVLVAQQLQRLGFATLMFDLLTDEEASGTARQTDLPLLGSRIEAVSHWAASDVMLRELRVGYFASGTGAAAALMAAANRPAQIRAVVSSGGKPDAVGDTLPMVRAPTLLIVGGDDFDALEDNRMALEQLGCEKSLEVIADSSHRFEEPGALRQVMEHAAAWFQQYLQEG